MREVRFFSQSLCLSVSPSLCPSVSQSLRPSAPLIRMTFGELSGSFVHYLSNQILFFGPGRLMETPTASCYGSNDVLISIGSPIGGG